MDRWIFISLVEILLALTKIFDSCEGSLFRKCIDAQI